MPKPKSDTSPTAAFACAVGVHRDGLVPMTSANETLSDDDPKTFNSATLPQKQTQLEQ
jgi:hypothetical protein